MGHELVHAFQYDMGGVGKPTSNAARAGIYRLPLWFIEGMAEYLSIGPYDPNTAMWMRDAIQRKKFPTVDKLGNPRYFPYRYGQALWAYIAGTDGDSTIAHIFRPAGRSGKGEQEIQRTMQPSSDTLKISMQKLSEDWKLANQNIADQLETITKSPDEYGRPIFPGKKDDMELNVSPAISPDGKKILFLSTRDLFAIDLYLAEVATGKVIKKLTKTAVDPHYQSLQFINSSGSWDNEGKRIAFSAISKGKPVLDIFDVQTGKIVKEITLGDIGEVFSPTWSPDGNSIAFCALVGGLSDLYIINIETDQLKQVTQDPYADLQPAWSPDGKSIALVTDRFTTDLELLSYGDYQLALLDVQTEKIQPVRTFEQGKNINPQWSADGASLFFISDRGGISNIYRIQLASGKISQLTNLFLGVSGITPLSPALSVSQKDNKTAFCIYQNNTYNIFLIESAEKMAGEPVSQQVTDLNPALLPPIKRAPELVRPLKQNPQFGLQEQDKFHEGKYHPKLSLEYIGQPYLAIGSDRFGTYIGGGASLYWSDMMNERNLVTMLQTDGRVKDVSALVGYQNRRNRWNWMVVAERIAYVYNTYYSGYGKVNDNKENAYIEQIYWLRQINSDITGGVSYPFNKIQRVEFITSVNRYSFSQEVETLATSLNTGLKLVDDKQKIPSPKPVYFGQSNLALVFDNSLFGATSPILGQSYRLEVAPTFGNLNFRTALIDYRKYLLPVRPFTMAMRVMHYGRYGKDAEDYRLYPLYIGYQTLLRRYDYNSFSAGENFNFNRLLGSKMMVANFELRFPPFGIFGVGRGYYGVFPLELGLFYDAGVAWFKGEKPVFFGGNMEFLRSAGIALRFNAFGYVILELDLVKPMDRPDKGWLWQFGFTPGF